MKKHVIKATIVPNLKVLFKNFLESFISVLPILFIGVAAFLIQFAYNKEFISNEQIITFVICGILIAVGIAIFSFGVSNSMNDVGKHIGSDITKRNSIILVVLVCFLLGVAITIAEPDLTVLANYIPSEKLNPWVLKICVGVGVGIFLVIAILRILFNQPIKIFLIFFYSLVFMVACLYGDGESNFLELAFDSGGVTTGPITVPFIIAFGVGVAAIKGGNKSSDDSFGVTGLCSIGPVLIVMILGLIVKPGELNSSSEILTWYAQLGVSCEEVALGLSPVIIFFLIYNFAFLRLRGREVVRIMLGFVSTYIGLVTFLASANYGFIPVSKAIGVNYGNPEFGNEFIILIIALVSGAAIVIAEPAVHVLNDQVEEISQGVISKTSMLISLAVGVSFSVFLAVLRLIYFPSLKITYIFVPAYAIALGLTFLVDDIYTAIAFDSGGVASGAMASTFVLPMVIGIANVRGTGDGFGVVGFIAMMPLITIQILGLSAKIKIKISNKRARRAILKEENDVQIIHF